MSDMNNKDIRWIQRFQHFESAFTSLCEMANLAHYSEIEIDATIQRFEITYELAWKTLQDYLEERGYMEYKGPKNVITKAYQDGIIVDGNIWLNMNEDRNILSHTYDYEVSRKIFKNIINKYIPALKLFYEDLCNERDK